MQVIASDSEPAGLPAVVAVCTAEALVETSAGSALRAAGLASGLARHGLDVVFVAPEGSRAPDRCARGRIEDIDALVRSGATMIVSGFLVERHPALARAAHVVVDAAGPFLLENLVVHQAEMLARRRRVLTDEAAVLGRLLASADLVLCAHERQRDLMLGVMLASGALLPELIDADPDLARFLLTVPFGPTAAIEPVDRATTTSSLHLAWPGGLWDWLDPLTLIEGIALARQRGTAVTAELWGARSYDPLVPPSRAAALVAERARSLGVHDAVEILDWVPHADRRSRLARADAAVTLDPGGIEARYAFRTRLVDALALGLPVIATEGEFVADEAATRGAGFTIPPGDPTALADLVGRLAANPTMLAEARRHAPAVAQAWAYEETVRPLAAWCRTPRRARAGCPTISPQTPGQMERLRTRLQRAVNSSRSAR